VFTGLVLESARVRDLIRMPLSKGARLEVESCLEEAVKLPMGASVAINGVCLTLVDRSRSEDLLACTLAFEVSPETLERSNLGELSAGFYAHLEFPLQAGAPLGGHVVSGHVDAMASIVSCEVVGDYQSVVIRLTGEARKKVAPFLVEKGSIAVDGVSLTVNRVTDSADGITDFEIMLIPHTLSVTWPDGLMVGRKVNLEADLMAKHVIRFRQFSESSI
jgi:riboflavin synthase